MNLALKETKDGSYTLFNKQLNETYHSIHGARQEAIHVFIDHGLNQINKDQLRILEIGLGTGFNALLTSKHAQSKTIEYVGLEPFPVEARIQQAYIDQNAYDVEENEKWKALMAEDISDVTLQDFRLIKSNKTLMSYKSEMSFDLIYFDAFAPSKQEEMWKQEVFEHIYSLCHVGSRIVTYCAQGQFKRNLKHAGFSVESRPGPPGKREMTLGIRL